MGRGAHRVHLSCLYSDAEFALTDLAARRGLGIFVCAGYGVRRSR